MTARDRLVAMVVAVLVVLGGAWLLVVSPERKQATKLQTEVNAASAQLASAESELSNARAAQARYSAAYGSIVSLGKAVPPGKEVPALIYELALASQRKHVELSSIASTAASTGGSAGASASAAQGSGTTVVGFTQMPFTFIFNGSFFDLYHLFQQLTHFTVRTASGDLRVSGRLLTIQSAKLAPAAASAEAGAGKGGAKTLSGTITATAYVLPVGQTLTGGATPGSLPGGSAASATVAASGSSSSPSTTPAIVRVNP